MNKRILSFVAGVALVVGFSACEKEVDESGLKKADLTKAVDVKTIKATHPDCAIDYDNAGYDQAWFNKFGKQLNGSGIHPVATGIEFEKKGNDTWLRFDEGAKGTVTVAYKNGNFFAFMKFDAACVEKNVVYFDGKIYSVLRWDYEEEKDVTIPEVNIGLIGWYPHSGTVMQTSFHWINLKPGQCIDWEEVDAAFDAWMAKGGLKPARPTWVTSGFHSFAFNEEDGLCFEDITLGQLEAYYRAYYIDPGYVVCEGKKCDVCGKGCECGEFDCSNGPCICAPECTVLSSATVLGGSWKGNLQDANNTHGLIFKVTEVWCGVPVIVDLNVGKLNGQSACWYYFQFEGYYVVITISGGNMVTKVEAIMGKSPYANGHRRTNQNGQ